MTLSGGSAILIKNLYLSVEIPEFTLYRVFQEKTHKVSAP